jgi:hypothetical protein
MSPSNGRCGSGRTILASTCASTLCPVVRKCKRVCEQVRCTEFCLENTRHGLARRRKKVREDGPRGSHDRRYVRSGRVQRRKTLSLGLRVMADASSYGPDALTRPLQHCSPFATVRLAYGASLRWPALAELEWRITQETTNISLTVIHRASSPSAPTLPSASATRTHSPLRTTRNTILTMTNNNNALVLLLQQAPLHPTPRDTPRPHS